MALFDLITNSIKAYKVDNARTLITTSINKIVLVTHKQIRRWKTKYFKNNCHNLLPLFPDGKSTPQINNYNVQILTRTLTFAEKKILVK